MSVIRFIDWRAGLIALGVMLLLLAATKYMSLPTVTDLITCQITLSVRKAPLAVIILCTASVLYIAFRHRENFKGLINGT